MPTVDEMPVTGQADAALQAATSPPDLLRRLLHPQGSVAAMLRAVRLDPVALLAGAPVDAPATGLQGVRANAASEAALLGHRRVDLVHLFLALLYTNVPETSAYLRSAGVALYDLREHLQGPQAFRQAERLRAVPRPRLRGVIRVSPVFMVPLGTMIVSGAALYAGPPWALVRPLTILFVVAGWVTSLCLHEFGHALVGYLGGDRSVVLAGYLSLNPVRYMNPLFSLVLPVIFVLAGGIGLPGGAVYIDRRALRGPAWDSAVSAAGPLATLLFALVAALPIALWDLGLGSRHVYFYGALAFLVVIELGAFVLNLIPVPPLDGFGILAPLLSWKARQVAAQFGTLGLFAVFLVLWQGPVATVFWNLVFDLASALHVPPLLVAIGHVAMFGN